MLNWPPPAPSGIAKTVVYATAIGLGVLMLALILARWVPGSAAGLTGAIVALTGASLHAVADSKGAKRADALKLYGHALIVTGGIWAIGGFFLDMNA